MPVVFPVQGGQQDVVVELQRDRSLFDLAARGGAEGEAVGGGQAAGLSLAGGWAGIGRTPESELGCPASDRHRHDLPRQAGGAVEMHRVQPGRAPGHLAGVAAGAGDQDVGDHAGARPVEGELLVAQQRLDLREAGILQRLVDRPGHGRGRRAGARRVFEGEGLREADVADQRQRRFVVGIASRRDGPAMMSVDSARSGRAARSRSTSRR